MPNKRIRNIRIEFYVNHEEKFLIDKKTEISGKKTMSDYLRQAACYNKVQVYDFGSFKEANKELTKIGTNINQIVARINSTNIVYKEDIKYLKEAVEKIWQLQTSILSNLP